MDDRELIEEGVALFNAHEFWHAHEAWERIWLTSTHPDKRFLQGLIQLAAAYHHVKRGTFPGAGRLLDAALEKLSAFPQHHFGIDRQEAIRAATEHRARLEKSVAILASEYPKLRYNSSASAT